MAFEISKYVKDKRVVSYVGENTKEALKAAVDEGTIPSISKATSNIIEEGFEQYIANAKDGD